MKVPAENKIVNEPPKKAQYGRPNVDKVSTENIFRTITDAKMMCPRKKLPRWQSLLETWSQA